MWCLREVLNPGSFQDKQLTPTLLLNLYWQFIFVVPDVSSFVSSCQASRQDISQSTESHLCSVPKKERQGTLI